MFAIELTQPRGRQYAKRRNSTLNRSALAGAHHTKKNILKWKKAKNKGGQDLKFHGGKKKQVTLKSKIKRMGHFILKNIKLENPSYFMIVSSGPTLHSVIQDGVKQIISVLLLIQWLKKNMREKTAVSQSYALCSAM